MERFFDDSVIRGLATKAQQWGPSNVALQRGPDPKSIVMGVPMTGGPVTGVGGVRISLHIPVSMRCFTRETTI